MLFNDIPDYDPALALDEKENERWALVICFRDLVNKALEQAKEQGIKKNQDAEVTLCLDVESLEGWKNGTYLSGFEEADLAEIFFGYNHG